MLKQNLIRKNLFLCKRCMAIRIYEDSLFKRTEEQSKLCFRQTKTVLSDGNRALQGREETFAPKSQFRKKRSTNPKIRRMEKTNVTRTDRKPKTLKKSLSSRFFPVET